MVKMITAAVIIISATMMLYAQTATLELKQGFDEYTGCKDMEIRNPAKNYYKGPEDRVLFLSEYCTSCPYSRLAIQFDLSSIADTEEITGAKLELYVGDYNGGGSVGDYAIYRITRDWADIEADWENASEGTPWTTPGGDFVSEKIDEITVERDFNWEYKSFDVLETVKDFIANPAKNYGFLVRNTSGALALAFPSAEFERPEIRPKLTIEYSVPATGLTRNQPRIDGTMNSVKLTPVNGRLHVANNSARPALITLTRLDGTTVASEMLPGKVRRALSVRSAGVYLVSVSGDNFTLNEKVSLFR